ncbi:hypothetical protein V8C86DRAFT_3035873 [Haematococcus lacustris]
MSVSSMEEEEADTLATQAEAVHSQGPNRPKRAAASATRAKGTLNTAAEAVKGRAPRAKTGKEAWDEANKPPLKPATVWRLPDFDPINPDVYDVDSEEQRIAFARKVEDKGFAMMRLPERLHPSRFPKLLWALLFLVIQFAEVIFKEGTFDDEGNMTDVGNRLGTDFGTGQRLQMSVTKSVKGKLSDSAKIAGLTSPWANSQWEAMKKEAGDKVELLTRRLHMAVEVATLYLSKLMPFIQKVAGGAIKGGTIIGNDPMHMRKVVYYGKTDKFAYAKHPAHRTVEAQVAHVDVAPNTLNDSASLKAELDKAKHDPKAIQRHRDGMVFIIAIQTFYLLLCEDSVEWVLVTEAHAEALWGEKSTDAQKAAYAAKLKGMPKLYIKRVKVEAGSCVCIRGYLLHAGDVGQPDTISVRIHFYSSLGFVSGTTTYVHSLSKEFCMNVMPTVQPRHGWPLVQEFDNYRNVMVPLPPYEPPKQQEYDLHYRPEWDMELPKHHIKGLEQAPHSSPITNRSMSGMLCCGAGTFHRSCSCSGCFLARKTPRTAGARNWLTFVLSSCRTNVGQQSAMLNDWAEPVVVTSDGHFLRPGLGSNSTPINPECRETCLTTCDFLVLSIDSVSIYSHLPPRFLAALRGRRQPVMLMLTLEQRLGPYMTKCRVEGVIGFLGYCEAVQSVEIRLIMDEDTAEAPTYEQLPVGAWLAERLMSNFPNCQVLGIKPFLMQSSELVELLSHPLVVGRIQHLDIQTVNLTAKERVVLDAWVEPALGLTSLHATYLGPLPMSLRDRTCNLVELKVTEMYLTDVGNLPQSVSTLLVSALDVVLPEPNMAALNRSVADLSSGRFKHQVIGDLFMGIVRKEGCAAVAALQPLVGRFGKALVQECHVPAVFMARVGSEECHGSGVDPVAIASNGNFFRFGQRCTAIRKECHEPSLATCETLMLNIDSESIFSSLSPRLLTALRGRRLPLALQLIVTTPLKPHIFRGTVEGVLGLLGYCEAVHSVEIRFIYKQQAMEEAPTYAQLPVGAWLAERMMANFPQCLSLRLRGLQCAHPELAELLSHSQFMGRLQQLDIQQLHIQHGSVLDGHYEWVKGIL